ncbi:phenylacetate--CoA ligase family protein [Nocardiopsis rhodophaea]
MVAALKHARSSPFYKRRLPSDAERTGLDGLAELPLTHKSDLRESHPFGMLAVDRERLASYHESSGTAGEPTASYFTEGDWSDVVSRFTRSTIGLRWSDTVMVRTPYAMLTTGHQAHSAARSVGATVVPADNRSRVTPYPRVVRLLRELDVTVAWCLPSECLTWAAAARALGLRPERDFPALRGFLVAGEPLTHARRQRISELWGGVPVFTDYGSTETGSLAGECARGRLHLWADRFVAEVVDTQSGASREEGRGRLVITTLYREAMPLVRYDLEDLVEVSWGACDCDWQLPTVTVLGRAGSGQPGPSQADLETLVHRLPLEYEVLFWRARPNNGVLNIEVEAAPARAEAAASQLAQSVKTELRIPAEVRALEPGALMPKAALVEEAEFVKPRNLFREDEDWSKGVTYY